MRLTRFLAVGMVLLGIAALTGGLVTPNAATPDGDELSPCKLVSEFRILNRPSSITQKDMEFVRTLFTDENADEAISELASNLPVTSLEQLGRLEAFSNATGIGQRRAFLLRVFFTLKGDERCPTELPKVAYFHSAVSTELRKPVDMDALFEKAKNIYDIVGQDAEKLIWKYTGTTGDYAFVFADGRLAVASKANFDLPAQDTLAKELNDAIDLINVISGVDPKDREHAVDHATYYATDAGVYHRIKYKYNGNFNLHLSIPDCTVNKATMTILGKDGACKGAGSTYHSSCRGNAVWGQYYYIGEDLVASCEAEKKGYERCKVNNQQAFHITPQIPVGGIYDIRAEWIDSSHTLFIEAYTTPTGKQFVLYSDDYKIYVTETTRSVSIDEFGEFTGLNLKPIVDFTFSPSKPTFGQEVSFDSSSSYDPDGAIVLYEWDFNNDGLTDDRGMKVSHYFACSGGWVVTLTVTDDQGAKVSKTKTVIVR